MVLQGRDQQDHPFLSTDFSVGRTDTAAPSYISYRSPGKNSVGIHLRNRKVVYVGDLRRATTRKRGKQSLLQDLEEEV